MQKDKDRLRHNCGERAYPHKFKLIGHLDNVPLIYTTNLGNKLDQFQASSGHQTQDSKTL